MIGACESRPTVGTSGNETRLKILEEDDYATPYPCPESTLEISIVLLTACMMMSNLDAWSMIPSTSLKVAWLVIR